MLDEAYLNEICRILNQDFFANGQEITPVLLRQLLVAVAEALTE